jgi:hypothetical protein
MRNKENKERGAGGDAKRGEGRDEERMQAENN